MMEKTLCDTAKLGFIGTGNMGGALARAAGRRLPAACIRLANRSAQKAEALAEELGCRTEDNAGAALWADFLFLGVKPGAMPALLAELLPVLAGRAKRPVLVTMAAGLSIARVREMAGGCCPVIRIMPNTPVSIGEGVILYACGEDVSPAECKRFIGCLADAGQLSAIPENLMDAGSAVSGCGPAFVDLFIEALADGGVACGLPRSLALELAARTVSGSARLVSETGLHPAALKDAVCSPGGTTIQGIRALEQAGFRSAVMEAVIAACGKNRELTAPQFSSHS